jgi:rare lipoprotein A (peptidoglycan hydrolase)
MAQPTKATCRILSRPAFFYLVVMALAAAVSGGCVPHPIYRSSTKKADVRPSPAGEASRSNAISPPIDRSSARPVDPVTISTRDAYQVGVASYYGEKFHGRKTANGEVFNMYKLTAAHRVLPLGTKIKVTHMSNGHSVVVKVNDRGPFIEGRVLDLSFAAALELEMVSAGTAEVMIEIVESAE